MQVELRKLVYVPAESIDSDIAIGNYIGGGGGGGGMA